MKKIIATLAFVCVVAASVFGQTAPDGFVRINGGTFTMGSPANEPGREDREGPQRQVTVRSFYMGKYEVTQKEWDDVMETNFGQQQDKATMRLLDNYYKYRGYNDPMFYVSWYDAIEYCNARSRKEGLTPAYTIDKSRKDPNNTSDKDNLKDDLQWAVTWNRNANGYRLPTEAEWEYACRAGTTTAYNTGASINDNTGWYDANAEYKPHSVGQKPANAWGLYDMHGNVLEWCWDWFGDYPSGAQTDPTGASSGSIRVLRGGCWLTSAEGTRSASRGGASPDFRVDFVGFRVARNGQETKEDRKLKTLKNFAPLRLCERSFYPSAPLRPCPCTSSPKSA